MKAIYADSSYWIALVNSRDTSHSIAAEMTYALSGCLVVTSEAVLLEFLNFASRPAAFRELAARKVRDILVHPRIEVISQSREGFLEALSLYEARGDKGYSLTDCLSMGIMERQGIREVLTTDEHFAQAGFTPLLT